MRRRECRVCLVLAGLASVMTSGCGSSCAVTGADEQPIGGASVLHGAILAPGISSSRPRPA